MKRRNVFGILFVCALGWPLSFCLAAPGTWTNTTGGASGGWTTDINWTGASHPGFGVSEDAFLTNNTGSSYTNTLNTALANPLSLLVISNSTGQAWLIITNTALTTGSFIAGNGSRIQVVDGGLTNTGVGTMILGFRGTTPAEMLVTNSTVASSGLTVGRSSSSNRLSILAGAVWNNNSQDFIIGSISNQPTAIIRATDNTLRLDGGGVSGGAILSNVATLFVGGPTLVNVGGVGNTFSLSNSLTIANGGVMLTTTGAIGISTGPGSGYSHWLTNNSVMVTGTGSIWSNRTAILVGGNRSNATGAGNRLDILDHAQVFTADLFIGGGGGGVVNGASNQVVVSGAGTVLTVTNMLRLGYNRGNTGSRLTISEGAVVRGSNLVVASSDIVLVTGANSVLTNTGVINLGAADASQFAGERGMLIISNGARVFSTSGGIGVQHWNTHLPNSNSVTIVGGGSQWRITGGITVGGSTGAAPTNNNLTVANGGLLVSSTGTIGGGTSLGGSNNWALITGTGSAWTNTGNLVVGSFGHFSRLTIASGGAVISSNLTIGLQANSVGNEVVISGAGKLVVTNALGTGLLLVGGAGHGTLVLTNGSVTADAMRIAPNTGNGTFTWGAGGQLRVAGSTDPNAILTSILGPTMTIASGPTYIFGSNSVAVMTINTNINVSLNNALLLGWAANRSGQINWNAGSLAITNAAGSIGLTLGNLGTGTFVVGSGAQLITSYVRIGTNIWGANPTANLLLVTGPGSTWTNAGATQMGFSNGGNISDGSLVIANGATGITASVGINAGNNFVTVEGAKSLLKVFSGNLAGPFVTVSNNARLSVEGGTLSTPQLTVLGKGSVFSVIGILNYSAGAGRTNLISGSGSVWTNANGLSFSYNTSNTRLVISNSALLHAGSVYIGGAEYQPGTFSNNILIVTGNGSRLVSTNELVVGVAANLGGGGTTTTVSSNGLIVASGGQVISESGTIGWRYRFGGVPLTGVGLATRISTGMFAIVEGANSKWQVGVGGLVVGDYGFGHQLIVSNRGVVAVAGEVIIGQFANVSNTVVHLERGTLFATNAAGTAKISVGAAGTESLLVLDQGSLTANHLFINSTSTLTANLSRVTVGGVFTNTGTLSFINSRGTFGSVVNTGRWISDPSILTFNGVFSNAPSATFLTDKDTYIFRSDFINQIGDPANFEATSTKFIFDGGSAWSARKPSRLPA